MLPKVSTFIIFCLAFALMMSSSKEGHSRNTKRFHQALTKPFAKSFKRVVSFAKRKQYRKATQAFKQALRQGFWDVQRVKKHRFLKRLRRYKPFKKWLKRLKKDTPELTWLRMEIRMLSYEGATLLKEEEWRRDPHETRLYHNPIPTRIPATQAVKVWRKILIKTQKIQRFALSNLWVRRRRKFQAPNPRYSRFDVSGYERKARAQFIIQQSKKRAIFAYKKRKMAARMRAYHHCASTHRYDKDLYRLRGKWRWSYRHLHRRLRSTGRIRWRTSGRCMLGESVYRLRGKNIRLAMFLVPTTKRRMKLILFQPNSISFAKRNRPFKKKIFEWVLGTNVRLSWRLYSTSVTVKEYARNATDHWSLQSITKWRRR